MGGRIGLVASEVLGKYDLLSSAIVRFARNAAVHSAVPKQSGLTLPVRLGPSCATSGQWNGR
jgi:hypothetical protein